MSILWAQWPTKSRLIVWLMEYSQKVFANVAIMVLKHFWDPMTEITGEA